MPSRGYTIVEAMIVLAAIGLILGGILKGQELINNAKVRSLTDRTTTLRIAWDNFVLRYGAYPGDYKRAKTNIHVSLTDGRGFDGFEDYETTLAMHHLHGATLIRCTVCTGTNMRQFRSVPAPSSKDHPPNGFGGVISFMVATKFKDPAKTIRDYARTAFDSENRPAISLGTGVNSNVLSEIDRKIDDGQPHTGLFRAAVDIPDYSAIRKAESSKCLFQYDSAGIGVYRENGITLPNLSEKLPDYTTGGSQISWPPPTVEQGGYPVEDCAAAYLL